MKVEIKQIRTDGTGQPQSRGTIEAVGESPAIFDTDPETEAYLTAMGGDADPEDGEAFLEFLLEYWNESFMWAEKVSE